jgi:MoxR-like ATPase
MSHRPEFRLVKATPRPEKHKPELAFTALTRRKIPESLQDFRKSAPFFELDTRLETAINTALAVGAPLLLTGEPGTGKTQVAWYLGWYFGIEVYAYPVKSISTATDLKYDFDAVAYLRDANAGQIEPGLKAQTGEDETPRRHRYLDKKALWRAYDDPRPAVLLIDEIDKAPRDFPNDLLQELDKHSFEDPFSDRMITPKSGQPPIVVVTSNAERRLPDAFLRRCIYHHIELDRDLIRRAVTNRAGDFPDLTEEARRIAIERFWEIRDEHPPLQKTPATAELLSWLAILSAQGMDATRLRKAPLDKLPGIEALIKDREDRKRMENKQ